MSLGLVSNSLTVDVKLIQKVLIRKVGREIWLVLERCIVSNSLFNSVDNDRFQKGYYSACEDRLV
jgi:hypothetical protein